MAAGVDVMFCAFSGQMPNSAFAFKVTYPGINAHGVTVRHANRRETGMTRGLRVALQF